jgi:hypothetical protein
MSDHDMPPRRLRGIVMVAALTAMVGGLGAQSGPATSWWGPGQGTPLPAFATYGNEHGAVGLLNVSGVIDTKGHPFFEPIGTNGRACVTCHQPSDGMALSLRSIRERWTATQGKDPLFAAVDGMNCPGLSPDDPRSHSLLLERGLFRIALPWPPVRADGVPLDPEFTIEVVRDPLSHIIRNALDHGIEPPEERAGADKPAVALLRVVARQTGNRITIEVTDSGRGIDPDRVAARAVATGRMTAKGCESRSMTKRSQVRATCFASYSSSTDPV